MSAKLNFQRKFSALLVYGRPPLVFGGMLCAFAVMWTRNPMLYTLGVMLLFISMCFDLIDGWLATRFQLHSTLAHLADRVMDKIVYSTIFPLVAVGAMWRLLFTSGAATKAELLHSIFVLILCVGTENRCEQHAGVCALGVRLHYVANPLATNLGYGWRKIQ